MVTLTNTTDPVKLVSANPRRSHLKIVNLSNTTLYIEKDVGDDVESFKSKAFQVQYMGLFEIDGVHCYKGPIYALVSSSSEVVTWEN